MSSLEESGVPVEFCYEFEEKYYQVDEQNLKAMISNITTRDLPEIKMYSDALLPQLRYASGGLVPDIKLMTPDISSSAVTPNCLTSRKGGPQDFEVQLNAICDIMDFLVDQRDQMTMYAGLYKEHCKKLEENGVETHIAQRYDVNFAQPNLMLLDKTIMHIQDEDYKFFSDRYSEAVQGMVFDGRFFTRGRSPRKM